MNTLRFRAWLLCLSLLGPLCLIAQANPLTQNLGISFQNIPLTEAFERIEEAIDVRFSYNAKDLPRNKTVSVRSRSTRLKAALDGWFRNTDINYRPVGKQIVIYRETSTKSRSQAAPKKVKKPALSGYVVDSESGERLPYAKVWDLQTGRGTVSNAYGFFSLSAAQDSFYLMASFPEYVGKPRSYSAPSDQPIELSLQPYLNMKTISIEADKSSTGPDEAQMSTISLAVREVQNMPALLGEADVIRAVQLLPGVQSGAEGTTGIYVRGGSPDQNLILLDGVPLYYVNHWGGFASVFNADALSDVRLTKGGFPARFGGRLSSVMEVSMKEGNRKETQFAGSIGLLSAKASIQGPIGPKDANGEAKTSYILSARRNYFDLIEKGIALASQSERSTGPLSYGFYDINAKINHTFSPKDRLYLSTYVGRDRSRITDEQNKWILPDGSSRIQDVSPSDSATNIFDTHDTRIAWGNALAALRWNHVWSDKAFSNLTASYSQYGFETQDFSRRRTSVPGEPIREQADSLLFQSGISDAILRWEMDWYPRPQHQVKWGAQAALHRYRPGTISWKIFIDDTSLQDTVYGDQSIRGHEGFAFVEHDWRIGDRIRLNSGLHAALYRLRERTYHTLQPRLSARISLAPQLAFKASYARMVQYIHLLVNQSVGLPVDIWVPATDRVPPQMSDQIAAGLSWESPSGEWDASIEAYYKDMQDLIDYQEGYSYFSSAEIGWENAVETAGTGEAYGGEVFIRKRRGKFRGWLGYTMSWNWRQFQGINGGERYPFRYDRRHDFSLVAMYSLKPGIELSASWVYGTGQSITLATGRHESWFRNEFAYPRPREEGVNDVDGDIFLYEGGRNNVRMRAYHRLDVGITMRKEKKWGTRIWRLGLYNAYGRRNPFYYFYEDVRDNEGQTRTALMQFSLFPVTPSISYGIEF